MGDGSFLAFFEAPAKPFEFKDQHDFDLHIALEVDYHELEAMLTKGKEAGIETRGIADHSFVHSIYFRDPNGYVIELTAKTDTACSHGAKPSAHDVLSQWQELKRAS